MVTGFVVVTLAAAFIGELEGRHYRGIRAIERSLTAHGCTNILVNSQWIDCLDFTRWRTYHVHYHDAHGARMWNLAKVDVTNPKEEVWAWLNHIHRREGFPLYVDP